MIRSLRKRHFLIWIVLAVWLPAGIFSAWTMIPRHPAGLLLQPAPGPVALPVISKTIKRAGYQVALRTDAAGSVYQLEWAGAVAITVPSALVYQVGDTAAGVENGRLLGRIDARGIYDFPVARDSTMSAFHFLLYDAIHHQVLDRINFAP